jgi:hypothetical protein
MISARRSSWWEFTCSYCTMVVEWLPSRFTYGKECQEMAWQHDGSENRWQALQLETHFWDNSHPFQKYFRKNIQGCWISRTIKNIIDFYCAPVVALECSPAFSYFVPDIAMANLVNWLQQCMCPSKSNWWISLDPHGCLKVSRPRTYYQVINGRTQDLLLCALFVVFCLIPAFGMNTFVKYSSNNVWRGAEVAATADQQTKHHYQTWRETLWSTIVDAVFHNDTPAGKLNASTQ